MVLVTTFIQPKLVVGYVTNYLLYCKLYISVYYIVYMFLIT